MRPINRILCPVDLSDVSPQAMAHAALMARWVHGTDPIVIGVHSGNALDAMLFGSTTPIRSCAVRPARYSRYAESGAL